MRIDDNVVKLRINRTIEEVLIWILRFGLGSVVDNMLASKARTKFQIWFPPIISSVIKYSLNIYIYLFISVGVAQKKR